MNFKRAKQRVINLITLHYFKPKILRGYFWEAYKSFFVSLAKFLTKEKSYYGQYAEDLWIQYFLKNPKSYIDVGANAPVALSNTYLMYTKGARGVLVEPTDYLCNQLRKERPGDTVLSVGLGAKKGAACLFQFTEHPANTFDRGEAEKNKKVYTYLGEKEIDIVPLSDVMEKYGVPDVLSIDVEGMSIDVLEGNSWDRYRPGLVVIEGLYHSYMRGKGYKKVLFNGLNSFYLDARRRS